MAKNKYDFYIAFYEQLALQGFQAYVAYDKEHHIADICVNGNNIAHLTKTDYIEQNPHANADTDHLEKIGQIMRETALAWGICTEKPYDENKHKRLPDGSYELSEFDGAVLSCNRHPILGYVFSTFKQDGQPDERQDFYDKAEALRDFAVKSGLVDERQIFTGNELAAIYNNAIKIRIMPDNDLTAQETEALDSVIEKIEYLVPELADIVASVFENEHEAEQEGTEV